MYWTLLKNIGINAFADNSYITSVNFADNSSLQLIDAGAFSGTTTTPGGLNGVLNLSNMTSLTTISNNAFEYQSFGNNINFTNCNSLNTIGEFAFAEAQGDHPDAGYVIKVNPVLKKWPEWLVYAVLYHLVTINYGKFATAQDAEAFGAAALGITAEQYYHRLCALQDAILDSETSGFLLIQEPDFIPEPENV